MRFAIVSLISRYSSGFFMSLSRMSLILTIFPYNAGVLYSKNVTHTSPNQATGETHDDRWRMSSRHFWSARFFRSTEAWKYPSSGEYESEWSVNSHASRRLGHTFSDHSCSTSRVYSSEGCLTPDCSHEYYDRGVASKNWYLWIFIFWFIHSLWSIFYSNAVASYLICTRL